VAGLAVVDGLDVVAVEVAEEYGVVAGVVFGPLPGGVQSVRQPGQVAPDWPTGVALGIGGLFGAYTGARLQSRLPDTLIRRLVGILVIAIGSRYLWVGLS
jgi:uncharacterized protein